MSVLAWILAAVWGLILMGAARWSLRRLPGPTEVVPPYTLWLPDGGEAPELEPAPAQVVRGGPPQHGPEQILVLCQVSVAPDLPGRLAACGADFVSVFPMPSGAPMGLAIERLRRDFAGAEQVNDPRTPHAFADPRCAWLRRSDLSLPAVGVEPVLRAARARKLHGLPVELRDPRGPRKLGQPARPALVRAPAEGLSAYRHHFPDMVGTEPLVRWAMIGLPPLLCLTPLALLASPAAREPALLALLLGSAARGMSAWRDGFGLPLALLGWGLEPALAWLGARSGAADPPVAFPAAPEQSGPALTASKAVRGARWLDKAAVPFLARRLGGATPVMEQVYASQPAGLSPLGRFIDRAVHASPGARALRHRRLLVAEMGRAQGAESLLSVPCGGGRDAADIGASRAVLVDPDVEARTIARANVPGAEVVDATVESSPAGPFDLALYIGLSEYLEDGEVVRHLEQLRGRLRPSGALITSCTADYPERARMARWLGWETRARTPEAMARLLDAAGYHLESRRCDPMRIQWVFTARPRPTE